MSLIDLDIAIFISQLIKNTNYYICTNTTNGYIIFNSMVMIVESDITCKWLLNVNLLWLTLS